MNQLTDARDTSDDLDHVAAGLGSDLDVMVIYNVVRTAARLAPALDAALRERGLTAAQLNALLVLRHAGGVGLRMGELGQRLVVSKANVTGLIDRLERQGLVERHALADRRATLVRLSPAGRRLVQRARPAHVAALAALTEDLAVDEKEQLVHALGKLRRALRRRRKEMA